MTTFSFSSMRPDGSFSASGQLNATPNAFGPNTYQVTSITGTVQGVAITGLSNFGNADNALYYPGAQPPNSEVLDGRGLGFTTANGAVYNIFNPQTAAAQYSEADAPNIQTPFPGGAPVALTIMPVCYAAGTLIRTSRGEIPVEHLTVGDLAVTLSGALRPITWLGHRTIEMARHPAPHAVLPYRVRAGTFGPGLPDRDLLLSPAHSVLVDDVLIQVRHLANGSSIAQIEVDRVTYWHVELESHDVILASGLPAESYVDTGNRGFFANGRGAVALHASEAQRAPAAFCRPVVESGPLLAAVRARLAGIPRQPDAIIESRVRLVVDGAVVTPTTYGTDEAVFAVPAGAVDVRLTSPTLRNTTGYGRRWGVLVRGLAVGDDAGWASVPLDGPRLLAGFHAAAADDDGAMRWTDGDASLSAELWAGRAGPVLLRVRGQFLASETTVDDAFAPVRAVA